MRYMLDTNICIYALKGHPDKLLEKLESLNYGDAVVSVITLAELRAGIEMNPATREQNDRALHALLEDFPVLHFDEQAACHFGELRAAVRERNRDSLDRLIAAHARSTSLTLITNNETDFRAYPGLSIENWAKDSTCN